jgi:hypothetical protein
MPIVGVEAKVNKPEWLVAEIEDKIKSLRSLYEHEAI